VCVVVVVYLFLNSFSFYQAIQLLSRRLSINIYICICICTARFIVSCLSLLNIFAHIKLFGFQAARVSINICVYMYMYVGKRDGRETGGREWGKKGRGCCFFPEPTYQP